MVKKESLDPYLMGIGRMQLNLPCCNGYLTKRYRQGLDLLIHKDTEDHRQYRLRPILLFEIKANIKNGHIGSHSMRKEEYMGGLAPEKYGRRALKAAEIQALNKRLLSCNPKEHTHK